MDCCVWCAGPLVVSVEGLYDNRFGTPGSYHSCRCSDCGLEQLQPRPTPLILRDLYETHYNFRGTSVESYSSWRERFLRSRLYRLWMAVDGDISFHSRRGPGRLLDVGCNEGRGMEFYRDNGFETEGTEINSVAAIQARERGFTVHDGDLGALRSAHQYDVVVLSNVLEHSLDPKEMLQQVSDVLVRGGEVWISCPNIDSLWRRIFGRSWINWHVPFHITHFSPTTLGALLQSAGFRVVSEQQATPALWVAMSAIAVIFARAGRPTTQLRNRWLILFLVPVIRVLLFPILALANLTGSGDCLLVRGQRQ